jgi:hypothetical protein
MKCAVAASCTGNPGDLSLDASFNLLSLFGRTATHL